MDILVLLSLMLLPSTSSSSFILHLLLLHLLALTMTRGNNAGISTKLSVKKLSNTTAAAKAVSSTANASKTAVSALPDKNAKSVSEIIFVPHTTTPLLEQPSAITVNPTLNQSQLALALTLLKSKPPQVSAKGMLRLGFLE
jgi:hypothetical protein